jgi:hypothetical protein
MALIKDMETPRGVTASYWIISSVTIDKINKTGQIQLAGYENQARRLQYPRRGIAARKSYTVSEPDLEIIYQRAIVGGENIYVVAYNYVKGTEKGAPDSVEPNPVWWTDARGNLSFFADAENQFEDL